MNKDTFFLIIVFLVTNIVSSQESCYNLDFESGTLSGWVGGTESTNFGIVKNRHTIMKGEEMDPYSCGKIPIVAPGGSFSAKLGNDIIGENGESLSYSLDVTEANSLFIYKYAVVLQDPGHSPEQQPYFRVNIFNENRELVNPACGSYNVVATSNLSGFETCDAVIYKDWTTVALDLSPYIGENVTVEFETRDCTEGGHFGYAYIDAYCSSRTINSTYCATANQTILSAPIGFTYLWETGETTQTIKIDNPIFGKKYTCTITSETDCKVDLSTDITFQEPIIDFEVSGSCNKSDILFVNTTSNTENSTNSFHWDFGDGTTSDIENPKHQYASEGDYDVYFTLSNSLGCNYSMPKTIKIFKLPEPHLNDGIICLDPSGNVVSGFILDSGLPDEGFTYQWFLNGKKIPEATSTCLAIKKGDYSVLATDIQSGCSNQAFAKVESSQMASDFMTNANGDFTETDFIKVDVIGGTGPFLFQLDDNPFQESNIFDQLPSGDYVITIKDATCTFISKPVTILWYPKFFTPNNDGFNDYWNIPNYKIFFQGQIHIFDRYGKLIKEITPSDLGWDGTHAGNLMPASDYWFTFNYKVQEQNGNLKSKTFKSHFSLKR